MATMIGERVERPAAGRIWRAGLIGTGLAIVANLVLYFILLALGVTFEGTGPDGAPTVVPPTAVALFTVIPGLIATLLYWGLTRVTDRAPTIFLGIAVVVLLLSFIPNFTLPLPLGTRFGLAALHIPAAICIAGSLLRLGR